MSQPVYSQILEVKKTVEGLRSENAETVGIQISAMEAMVYTRL